MAKAVISFETFLESVPPPDQAFVSETHSWLTEQGYTMKIAEAKNGYVVSYNHPKTKNVLFNYVFRKKGIIMRIYADNLVSYLDFLSGLPADMKAALAGAPNCRRMLSPELCNPKCKMGYDFILDGERHQKCRINAFMILIDDDSKPVLRGFLERETQARA